MRLVDTTTQDWRWYTDIDLGEKSKQAVLVARSIGVLRDAHLLKWPHN